MPRISSGGDDASKAMEELSNEFYPPNTPSYFLEPWDAAAGFLGEAAKACSLLLFSVTDPATGHGHYCHMNDLRPLLSALRRFPHHHQIAVWVFTILKDVSVTHANMVKIGKLK